MRVFGLLLATTAALALGGAGAEADGVTAGTLSCHVSPGWGYFIASSRELHCDFQPTDGPVEHYRGTVSKFGLDLGYTTGGELVWDVVAPETDLSPGALAGQYAGATASITAGVGFGANALIGGIEHSVALQPLSMEGNTGLNLAAGLGAIELHYEADTSEAAPPPPPG
ncbi:MAG TPA: DUF992 domain-containing protein [Rhizomicrobium sp.]|jgi:hypothetical protein|nr:DUF992 domain-containing protein [Rhizomicrobium sp.]